MEQSAGPIAKKSVRRITPQGLVCFLLLTLHAALLLHALRQNCVTVDEGGHVLSGLLAWKAGRMDYCSVNPPLVKALVALPVAWSRPELPDSVRWDVSPSWVPQHEQFVRANRLGYLELIFRARLVLVALSVVGGWLVYRWAGQLFGPVSGLVALALWTLCPNILCWAGVCTVDLGAAVFALGAAYAFRYYLRRPGWPEAAWAGCVLGLALLSKFSLLVLYPVFLLVWLAAAWRGNGAATQLRAASRCLQFAAILLVSLLVVNLGYGFQGTGRPIGSFAFESRALAGGEAGAGNRFSATWLAKLPVPLPEAFVTGLDHQKADADRGYPAYLWGKWQQRGWWYYYLVAAAVKVPLATWLLGLLAGALACGGRRFRAPAWEEALLWVPAATIFVLLSSQTGINSHFRYLLPAFPFVFIGIGRVGKLVEEAWGLCSLGLRPRLQTGVPAGVALAASPPVARARVLSAVGAGALLAALAWNGATVARIHPHYLSYFNEVAGGPDNGWHWLVESNIDWGQDLLFLKQWHDAHPQAWPLGLAYYGGIDPHVAGLSYVLAPTGSEGPRPGWYAVSVNFVCGASFGGYDERGRNIGFLPDAYTYFRNLTPEAKAGYSIFIYQVTPEQANALRRKLGLPPLPPEDPRS